jgi:hypothetical protein
VVAGLPDRAIRTERHQLIHWVQHPEFDGLYELKEDPRENATSSRSTGNHRLGLRSELGKLVQESISL